VKFTVAKNDFMDAYKIVATTLSSADNMSSNVLFRVRKGMVEMLSFNGTTRSMCPMVVTGLEGNTSFCMEGKRISLLLNAIQGNEDLQVSFDTSTKIVSIKGTRGTQQFKTFNTTTFPVYDNKVDIEGLPPVAQVRADAICHALKSAKAFTDSKNLRKEFSVIALSEGRMFSTDQSGICLVDIPGMEGVDAFLLGDAARSTESFLSKFKDQMVSLISHAGTLFYLTTDGAIFGETAPPFELSVAAPPVGTPLVSWTVSKEDVEDSFQWLRAGADWSSGLRANLINSNGNLLLECKSNTGDSITRLLEATSVVDGSEIDVKVPMNLDSLSRMFDVCQDTVTLNVSEFKDSKGKSVGTYYLWSVVRDDIGNTYTFLIAQE